MPKDWQLSFATIFVRFKRRFSRYVEGVNSEHGLYVDTYGAKIGNFQRVRFRKKAKEKKYAVNALIIKYISPSKIEDTRVFQIYIESNGTRYSVKIIHRANKFTFLSHRCIFIVTSNVSL